MNCSICHQNKLESEFSFRNTQKGIRFIHCKSCQAKLRKQSYKRNRQYFLQYAKDHYPETKARRQQVADFLVQFKTGKCCADCSKTFPHYVLDFDHLPKHTKRFQIAKSGKYYSLEELQKEIVKCELVCANCHRERTWKREHGG